MRLRHGVPAASFVLLLAACDRGLPSPIPVRGPEPDAPQAGAPVDPEGEMEAQAGPEPAWEAEPPGEPVPPEGLRRAVAGRWRAAYEEIELFANGRLLLRRGASRGLGRYEWVERDRILIAYGGMLAGALPGDYRVAVAGSTLSLCETDAPERCIRFARWKPADGPTPGTRADAGPPRLALPPRADQIPPEARMKEGEVTLRHAYAMQQTYRAERGEYARNMFQLQSVGWEPPTLRHFLQPRLIREGARFCIVAEPRTPDLWPLYVDETGEIRQGRDCP